MIKIFRHRKGAGVTEYIVILAILLGILGMIFWDHLRLVLMDKVFYMADTIEVAGTENTRVTRSRRRGGSDGTTLTNPFENVSGGSSGGGYGVGGSSRPF